MTDQNEAGRAIHGLIYSPDNPGFEPIEVKRSAFDEIYSETVTFTPAEEYDECNIDPDDWESLIHPPDVVMKTVGQAHFSLDVSIENVPRKTLGVIFGVDRYMDAYGRHRISDESLWEYKTFDGFEGLRQNAYGAFFFKKEAAQ